MLSQVLIIDKRKELPAKYKKILEDGDAQIECVPIGGKCYNEMTTLRQMFETMFRLISQ